MVDEGSVILTYGGGMSMGEFMPSGFVEEKCANKGEVDSLRLALNWQTATREVPKS